MSSTEAASALSLKHTLKRADTRAVCSQQVRAVFARLRLFSQSQEEVNKPLKRQVRPHQRRERAKKDAGSKVTVTKATREQWRLATKMTDERMAGEEDEATTRQQTDLVRLSGTSSLPVVPSPPSCSTVLLRLSARRPSGRCSRSIVTWQPSHPLLSGWQDCERSHPSHHEEHLVQCNSPPVSSSPGLKR